MSPIDAFWHLPSFFMPALATGLIAAAATKLLWRAELAASAGGDWWLGVRGRSLALMGGLALFGHDGHMATYGAMVVAWALALWWAALVRPRSE